MFDLQTRNSSLDDIQLKSTAGEPMPEPAAVSIAILTFRRPGELLELLPMVLEHIEEVEQQPGPPDYRVDVLVVDNDPAGSASSAVEQYASARVRYCLESEPGISAARNRALDECADKRLLVFIDDDERPAAGWLAQLLTVWQVGHPAAVAGRVVPEYEAEPEPFLRAGRFFERRSLPTGTELDVAAAGNLLLDLDQVRQLAVRFERRYGLSGGEDTLFSRTLFSLGAKMVWCDESRVVDKVPVDRMTRQWVLRRAWSHGNSAGLIRLDLRGARPRMMVALQVAVAGCLRMTAGSGRYLFGRVTGSMVQQARGLRMARRGGGMIAAAGGRVYEEYRR